MDLQLISQLTQNNNTSGFVYLKSLIESNYCDDDGNNAADGSALVTFMPHAHRARTQVAHEAPGKQRTPERRPAKLRLLEATVLLCAKSISA